MAGTGRQQISNLSAIYIERCHGTLLMVSLRKSCGRNPVSENPVSENPVSGLYLPDD